MTQKPTRMDKVAILDYVVFLFSMLLKHLRICTNAFPTLLEKSATILPLGVQ